MKLAALVLAIVAAACGGKAKSSGDPGSTPSCCCVWGEGQDVVAEASCRERGGTCDPVDACDNPGEGAGSDDSDPGDY